jgi:maltose 6'-phosphate phosphatase
VGGSLAQTVNSGMDLKKKLFEKGMDFRLSYRFETGLPDLLSVGNAILSRYEILFTLSKTLPCVSEEFFYGMRIPVRRIAMMSRILMPGYWRVNIYNTHLCAFYFAEERCKQVKALLDFIDTVEACTWGDGPIVLGEDFNIDMNESCDGRSYELITEDGFIDSFAEKNSHKSLSCCEAAGDAGCAFAVDPSNPYVVNPFIGKQAKPSRIDYIFTKGVDGANIIESKVVFRGDPYWVSDHSSLITKIKLQ